MIGGLCPAVPTDRCISEQAAQENSTSVAAGLLQNSQVPAEIGRISYRSLQSQVQPVEVAFVCFDIAVHIGGTDVLKAPANRPHIWTWVNVAAGRSRPFEALTWHSGVCRKRAILFGQGSRRKWGYR